MSRLLAELNAYIRSVSPGAQDGGQELASARRFRETWSLAQAQDKVDLASLRRPAKAGPLNSHALVLESLARVQALSPAYLRRLLAQVDTLQWLEQAAVQYPPLKAGKKASVGGKSARGGSGGSGGSGRGNKAAKNG